MASVTLGGMGSAVQLPDESAKKNAVAAKAENALIQADGSNPFGFEGEWEPNDAGKLYFTVVGKSGKNADNHTPGSLIVKAGGGEDTGTLLADPREELEIIVVGLSKFYQENLDFEDPRTPRRWLRKADYLGEGVSHAEVKPCAELAILIPSDTPTAIEIEGRYFTKATYFVQSTTAYSAVVQKIYKAFAPGGQFHGQHPGSVRCKIRSEIAEAGKNSWWKPVLTFLEEGNSAEFVKALPEVAGV